MNKSNEKHGILYISCGVPGSGKTSWLKSHIRADEILVSRDDIRFAYLEEAEKEYDKVEYFSCEGKVFPTFVEEITKYINGGANVYADATHLNKASVTKLLYALEAEECEPEHIELIYFKVPLDICLERNELRKGTKAYVPKGVIKRMYSTYEPYKDTIFEKIWEIDENGTVYKVPLFQKEKV